MSENQPQKNDICGIEVEVEGDTFAVQQLLQLTEQYFQHHPRGQQLLAHLRGEGTEPEPLYMTSRTEDGEPRTYLGAGDVNITGLDLSLEEKLQETFGDNPE